LALAGNFVADPFLQHISDFKKIISGPFTIIPQKLKWFPLKVPRIMDLATGVIFVAVIIPLDFGLLEFLLQQLDVTFEEFLEIGFDA
jgi:hypothetical protein